MRQSLGVRQSQACERQNLSRRSFVVHERGRPTLSMNLQRRRRSLTAKRFARIHMRICGYAKHRDLPKWVAHGMDTKAFSKYFKAFGDPSRLRILRLLASKELTVNEIVESVGLSQPTVSRHLAILRGAGIVVDRRDGQHVCYTLNQKTVGNCCKDFCCCLAIPLPGEKKQNK